MVLSPSDTSPVSARSLPFRSVAPVFAVMLAYARILPSKAVPVPRVAEPVSHTQYTPSSEPLFEPRSVNTTDEEEAVVSELPTRKTQPTPFWPLALRVSAPFNVAVVDGQE
jgi:hypothetical protein